MTTNLDDPDRTSVSQRDDGGSVPVDTSAGQSHLIHGTDQQPNATHVVSPSPNTSQANPITSSAISRLFGFFASIGSKPKGPTKTSEQIEMGKNITSLRKTLKGWLGKKIVPKETDRARSDRLLENVGTKIDTNPGLAKVCLDRYKLVRQHAVDKFKAKIFGDSNLKANQERAISLAKNQAASLPPGEQHVDKNGIKNAVQQKYEELHLKDGDQVNQGVLGMKAAELNQDPNNPVFFAGADGSTLQIDSTSNKDQSNITVIAKELHKFKTQTDPKKGILSFPVNVNERHWISLIVDFRTKKIFICDSQGRADESPEARQKLQELMKNIKTLVSDPTNAEENWEIVNGESAHHPSVIQSPVQFDDCTCAAQHFKQSLEYGSCSDENRLAEFQAKKQEQELGRLYQQEDTPPPLLEIYNDLIKKGNAAFEQYVSSYGAAASPTDKQKELQDDIQKKETGILATEAYIKILQAKQGDTPPTFDQWRTLESAKSDLAVQKLELERGKIKLDQHLAEQKGSTGKVFELQLELIQNGVNTTKEKVRFQQSIIDKCGPESHSKEKTTAERLKKQHQKTLEDNEKEYQAQALINKFVSDSPPAELSSEQHILLSDRAARNPMSFLKDKQKIGFDNFVKLRLAPVISQTSSPATGTVATASPSRPASVSQSHQTTSASPSPSPSFQPENPSPTDQRRVHPANIILSMKDKIRPLKQDELVILCEAEPDQLNQLMTLQTKLKGSDFFDNLCKDATSEQQEYLEKFVLQPRLWKHNPQEPT